MFQYNDGGRAAAGYKGFTGDCVVRSVAIATEQPYQAVYDALSDGCRTQRRSKWSKKKGSARDGVSVTRLWFKKYMEGLGWEWVPTMGIGTGCKVHLCKEELPGGRLIVSVSKHFTAFIDGVINDNHDPSRDGKRCVYGYWRRPN